MRVFPCNLTTCLSGCCSLTTCWYGCCSLTTCWSGCCSLTTCWSDCGSSTTCCASWQLALGPCVAASMCSDFSTECRGLSGRPPQDVVFPQRLSTSFKWRRRKTLKTAHVFQHLSTKLKELKAPIFPLVLLRDVERCAQFSTSLGAST